VEPTNVPESGDEDGREVEGPTEDWHPADVLAALRKRGLSLAGLSVSQGYHPTAAGKALKRPWPAMEKLIADALGMAPQSIWPQRYNADGAPRTRRSRP
jgi:Ner family transcriptional regulator